MMTFHHLIRFPLIEVLGTVWCMLNGPIAYLTFNSDLRVDFLAIFLGMNKTAKKMATTFIPQFRRRFGKKTNAVYSVNVAGFAMEPIKNGINETLSFSKKLFWKI